VISERRHRVLSTCEGKVFIFYFVCKVMENALRADAACSWGILGV